MKKIILVYGLISGFISAGLMQITLPLVKNDTVNYDNGLVIGYAAIVLSFVLVFLGIRSYRNNFGGGYISFGKAFYVGIIITLISCVFYVVSWLIIYYNFMPDFVDKWCSATVAKMKASGTSQEKIAAKMAEMAQMKMNMDNPFLNAAYSFTEPFPVGLLITLISAAILRKKKPAEI